MKKKSQQVPYEREFSAAITRRGQLTVPAEVRTKLGVNLSDRVKFVIRGDVVTIEPQEDLVTKYFGSMKALPGQEAVEFDEIIREAMEERAAEIVRRMNEE
jgi:AbrB family looped-hinge helix DNA binding protein